MPPDANRCGLWPPHFPYEESWSGKVGQRSKTWRSCLRVVPLGVQILWSKLNKRLGTHTHSLLSQGDSSAHALGIYFSLTVETKVRTVTSSDGGAPAKTRAQCVPGFEESVFVGVRWRGWWTWPELSGDESTRLEGTKSSESLQHKFRELSDTTTQVQMTEKVKYKFNELNDTTLQVQRLRK